MKTSPEVVEIIKKWYKELAFPSKYDEEFYVALENIYVDKNAKAADYDLNETDGRKNLLYHLYFCEDLKTKYIEKGISLDFFYDNMQDIVRWTNTWSRVKGELYLGELGWLSWHFKMKLFKIGRLQYNMTYGYNIPEKNLKKDDNFIGIHIPASGPLDEQECKKSLKMATEFFKTYFPDFKYKHMACFTWLLSPGLKEMVKSDSNILKFQELFDIYEEKESDAIIRFVIGWATTRDEVRNMEFDSRFKNEIKRRVLADEKFTTALGIVKKEYM